MVDKTNAANNAGQEPPFEEILGQLEQKVARKTQDLQATINALENEITERKRMEEALTLSRERIKHMSVRILETLEAD
ncbi:hypothetical protein [Desulfococcus sp.]|uniref:hypothetical protein n=1 Tax=Desulfococcus sp. TaxID=2025834 RepID=UPI00359353CB